MESTLTFDPIGNNPVDLGYSFSANRYCHATKNRIEIAYGWPNPQVWVKTPSTGWVQSNHFSADARLNSMEDLRESHGRLYGIAMQGIEQTPHPLSRKQIVQFARLEAILGLMRTFPSAWVDQVGAFRERRWPVLCMLAKIPSLEDLLASNPVLTWALCNYPIFRSGVQQHNSLNVVQHMAQENQHSILAWLGFPGNVTCRRILQRIVPFAATSTQLLGLRQALKDADMEKILSHQKKITAALIEMAVDPCLKLHMTPRIASAIVQSAKFHFSERVIAVLRQVVKNDPNLRPGKAAEQRLLKVIEAQSMDLYDYWMIAESFEFPKEPYPGNEVIVPLRTPFALMEEGLAMRHCVGSYATEVAAGKLYVYAVYSPVRATLCLQYTQGAWTPVEVAGIENQSICTATAAQITQDLYSGGMTNNSHDDLVSTTQSNMTTHLEFT